MTDAELLREREELHRVTANYREHIRVLADQMLAAGHAPVAGGLYVLDRVVFLNYNEVVCRMAPPAPTEPAPAERKRPAPGKRAPKGQGEQRHKFNEAGVCACSAKRQRAPKGAKPDAAARTLPLPASPFRAITNGPGGVPTPVGHSAVPRPIGDDAPDRFDGGAFGSSSTSERR